MKRIVFFIGFLLLGGFSVIIAQPSEGGIPPSFNSTSRLKSAIHSEYINPPDMEKINQEDMINDRLSNKPYRIAKMIDLDLCMSSSGTWDTLSTGETIWRLTLYAPDAQGIQLIYNNFYLPKGTKLYIYNSDKSFVIGAYTSANNTESGEFATEIVPGERCTLEFVTNATVSGEPRICINKIGYVYRGIDLINPSASKLKASGACQVNVNCSPEGDNWQDVKRAVARIVMDGYLCTGTLLNNTAKNFKNYFATAFHCVDGIENTASSWVFYFNYERPGCNNLTTIGTQKTITGAYIRASIPISGGGDGALLELFGTIPANYNVYYAGWNSGDSVITAGACIHHPAGDVKKISTVRDRWYSSTWNGVDSTVGATNAHWYVTFSQTPNGYGTTEGGSSGSGIFGPDELFRGTLSGGISSCDIPSGGNLYGKLSYNWNKYSSLPEKQFKPWLDPGNTGITRIRGIDPNVTPVVDVYWTSSAPTIEIDSTIQFNDETIGSNLTRLWHFSGGNPSESTDVSPKVQYSQTGYYDVTLDVTQNGTTYTKKRTEYVYVKPKSAWVLQNTKFPTSFRGIQGISIVDSLTVWAWAYDGANTSNQITEFTRTIDGGTTWKADSIVADTLQGYGIGNIYPVSADTAYATIFGPSGGGKIVVTRDGGQNWQVQPTAKYSPPDGFPNFVYFFDKLNGVCGGDPNNGYFEIYTTSDGGDLWTRVPSSDIPASLSGEFGTTNFYYAKHDTLWFGTNQGRVYRTIDFGHHWTAVYTGIISGATNVKFKNAKYGFAYTQENPYTIKRTWDGGESWGTYSPPTNFLKGDLVFVNGTYSTWVNVSAGYPSGSSYTLNDGESFTSLDVGRQYTTVAFYNVNTGWAGTFNVDSLYGGIYKWDKENLILTDIKEIPFPVGITKNIIVYPNPAKNIVNIRLSRSFPGIVHIYLTDISGRKIKDKYFDNNSYNSVLQMEVSDVLPGVYILNVEDNRKIQSLKLSIMK